MSDIRSKKKNKADLGSPEYLDWLKRNDAFDFPEKWKKWTKEKLEYVCRNEESQGLIAAINKNTREWEAQYREKTAFELFLTDKPIKLVCKPIDSIFSKTRRENLSSFNRNESNVPIKYTEYINEINDLVRCTIVVKFLDGTEFVLRKIQELAEELGLKCGYKEEARDEGYFAIHVYCKKEYTLDDPEWENKKYLVSIEIQITTQLQDVIRKLTHSYYEKRREIMKRDQKPWQWQYKNDEFFANSLGHMLHYIEGMILDVRDNRSKGKI